MNFPTLRWLCFLGFPGSLLALLVPLLSAVELSLLNTPAEADVPGPQSQIQEGFMGAPVRLARVENPEAARWQGAARNVLAALPYGHLIWETSLEAGLDPLLVAAVVAEESQFQATAISPQGALGLMQLMPYHFESDRNPLDPATNVQVGTKLLRELEERFQGDLCRALAAYHAGPNRVERSFRLKELPQDTQAYLERVLRRLQQLHRAHVALLSSG
jgi:soluble lytic murein transglycosylase-like protein